MAALNPGPGMEKPKGFWSKPEGVTGSIVLGGVVLGGGYLLYKFLPYIISLTSNLIYLGGMLLVLGAIIYMVLDPRMRTLIGYMYKSMMRWITGIFVTIDPIGILKNYISDLENNLSKMSEQIGVLKGQIRKLQNNVTENSREIETQLRMAQVARSQDQESQMVLATRKAARLQETNEKYQHLLSKMDILNKVLSKMYQNSEILYEDTKDQVKLKEQERKAIRASHSAMKSAMNVISGNADQRVLFDQALEHIADDVANKVGEMERFMELSENFMNSVDLQNGVFEEEGLKMLQDYEEKSKLLLMGGKQDKFKLEGDLPERQMAERNQTQTGSHYDGLFKE
jgi:predicted  nucleic acid-binding Zn-ribbon protein